MHCIRELLQYVNRVEYAGEIFLLVGRMLHNLSGSGSRVVAQGWHLQAKLQLLQLSDLPFQKWI